MTIVIVLWIQNETCYYICARILGLIHVMIIALNNFFIVLCRINYALLLYKAWDFGTDLHI